MPPEGAAMRLAASLGLLLVLGDSAPPSSDLKLPDQLKSYKTWRAASDPFPVPYELWIQCALTSREQEAKAAQQHGPHNRLQVQMFTNAVASTLFYTSSPGRFPEGSIVVKEKSVAGAKSPSAIAAMIKGAPGSHPRSGDWEFVYVTSQGSAVATDACRDCHAAAPTDFLFRSYPSGAPK
jgi:hypothetical protein